MRLGIGCTALARGQLSGHMDGIGTYTTELLKHGSSANGVDAPVRVVFGRQFSEALPTGGYALPMVYSAAAATSAATGLPFLGAAGLESKIDLFHATDHYIPKLRRTPVVATIMDVIGIRHPEWVNPSLRIFKNALFKRAVGWADQITSIPLGVSADYFKTVPADIKAATLAKYGLRPGYFIAVGTLQPRKNVARIIQAHALLSAELRRQHPLVVVGQNGWRTDALMADLAQLEADGFGRWLKYVPRQDLFSLLQCAQALVFPSLYEGFGLPVLEGFASGIPVITSNTTSLPEVVGDAAVMVNPLSVEEIAHAMQRMVELPEMRGSLISKGLVQAEKFTWQQTAQRTQDVYRGMRV
jgi:glycosyltransferase involved in cell wall biosynthesis